MEISKWKIAILELRRIPDNNTTFKKVLILDII